MRVYLTGALFVLWKRTALAPLVLLLFPAIVLAGENPVLGTWKLKSFVRELTATGERINSPWGDHPEGYLSYSGDGRMYGIITSDNRPKPSAANPSDEERVKLHQTMIAYAGTYTLENGKVIHHVDISWNQAWTGTDQVRFYKLEGNILTITTAPVKGVDGREAIPVLVWEKIQAKSP
jgi:hypothetical protein